MNRTQVSQVANKGLSANGPGFDSGSGATSKRAVARPLGKFGLLTLMTVAAVTLIATGCVDNNQPPPKTTTTSSSTTSTSSTSTSTSTSTTSTSTSSTSTTTTIPGGPSEPVDDGPEFAFDEPSVMFTEEGGSVSVQLVEYDEGEETGTEVPGDVTYEILGDTDAFDIDDLGDGGLRVTSDGTIGGIVIAARVPGQALAVTTEIYTVEPAEGVTVVDPANIVFPAQNPPPGVSVMDYRDGVTTDASVAGFTWSEILDRASFPERVDPDVDVDPGDLLDPDPVESPFVLRGTAPAVGTKLLSGGPNGIFGTVVGTSSTKVGPDGSTYSLVTVRLGAITDMYAATGWNPAGVDPDAPYGEVFDAEDPLVAAGVIPESYTAQTRCLDEGDDIDFDDCHDYEETLVMHVVNGDGSIGAHGMSASVSKSTTAVTLPKASADSGDSGDSGGSGEVGDSGETKKDLSILGCPVELSTKIGDFKKPQLDWKIQPKVNYLVNIDAKHPLQEYLYLAVGFNGEVIFSTSGTLQPQASVKISCDKTLGDGLKIPLLTGPLGPMLEFGFRAKLFAEFEVTVSAGPSVDMALKCSYSKSFGAGYYMRSTTSARFSNNQLLSKNPDAVKGCSDKKFDMGSPINSEGLVAKADMAVTGGLKLPMGFFIGGAFSGPLAEALGLPPDGLFFDIATVSIGVKPLMTLENLAWVLDRAASKSSVGIDVVASGKYGSEGLVTIGKALGIDEDYLKDLQTKTSGDLFSKQVPGINIYMSPVADPDRPLKVTVEGEEKSGTIEVMVDQDVKIERPMKWPTNQLWQNEPTTREFLEARMYVKRLAGLSFTRVPLPGGNSDGSTSNPDISFKVNKEICDIIDTDPVDVYLVTYTRLIGGTNLTAPAFVDKFKIRCLKPKLEFAAETLEFTTEETDSPKPMDLTATMLGGVDWSISDAPSWLTISPTTGTPVVGQPKSTIGLAFKVNCPPDSSQKYTATITAKATPAAGAEPVKGELKVSADCRDTFLDATPKVFAIGSNGGDLTVNVTSAGPHPVLVGKESQKGSGGILFLKELTTKQLTINIPKLDPSCDPKPKKYELPYTSWAADPLDGAGRGSFTIIVNQSAPPPLPPDKCTEAGSDGDPHILTFDGATYDAQTFGEYWYLKPQPGGPDIGLQVRNELWRPNGRVLNATIVTAASARFYGHSFEWYRRAADVGNQTKVIVDGETTAFADGESRVLQAIDEDSPEVSIVWTAGAPGRGAVWTVRSEGVVLNITEGAEARGDTDLQVRISVDQGMNVAGLLGTPDGDQSNDMTTSDGSAAYTLRQVRQHGLELIDLWGSWRITDLDDSYFSETYAGFDQTITVFDPADLAEVLAETQAYMEHFRSICEMPVGDDYDYAMAKLAIEILNGSPQTMLDDATCGYVVRGRVSTTLPGGVSVPVPGLYLSVDDDATTGGDRLRQCSATTDANGYYYCRLAPQPGDDQPETGTPPVDITLNGSWVADGPTIATATTSFTSFPLLGGAAASTEQDLQVDVSQLVGVHLDGVLQVDRTGDGMVPLHDWVRMTLEAFDSDGQPLGTFQDYVSADTFGHYTYSKYLPGHTESVKVSFDLGRTPRSNAPVLEFRVQPGSNALDGDLDFEPRLAIVSGSLTNPDGTPLGATEIIVDSLYNGALGAINTATVYPGDNGDYRVVIELPNDEGADSLKISAKVGPYKYLYPHVLVAAEDLAPGANRVILDYVYDPPKLELTGVLHDWDGSSITYDPDGFGIPVMVEAMDASDDYLVSTITKYVRPDGDGSYSLSMDLPVGTDHARINLGIGIVTSEFPYLDVNGIAPGANPVVFNHTFDPPRLRLSGVLLNGQGQGRAETVITVTLFDAVTGGRAIKTTYPNYPYGGYYVWTTPDETTGAYDTGEIPLAFAAKRVSVTYHEDGSPSNDDRTFDIVLGEDRLTDRVIDIDQRYTEVGITGVALTSGGLPIDGNMTGVYLDLTAYDDDGVVVARYPNVWLYPESDTGSYFTVQRVPNSAVRVTAEAKIQGGFLRKAESTAEVDVEPGLTQMQLDINYLPTLVNVTGSFDATDPQTGMPYRYKEKTRLNWQAVGSSNEPLASGTTKEFMIDAVNYSYYTTIEVPPETATLTLSTLMYTDPPAPYNDGSKMVIDGDDLVYGGALDVVFNPVYAPVAVNISGTAKIGGVPYANKWVKLGGTVTLESGQQINLWYNYYNLSTDENGNYSGTLLLYRGTRSANLTMKLDGAPNDVVTLAVDDLHDGSATDVTWNVDLVDFKVEVAGFLRFFDEVQNGPYPAVMHSFDSNGVEIEARAVTFDTSDGYFDHTFDLLPDTRTVSFTLDYTDPASGVVVPFKNGPFSVTPGTTTTAPGFGQTNGSYFPVDLTVTRSGEPVVDPLQVRARNIYTVFNADGTTKERAAVDDAALDVTQGPGGTMHIGYLTSDLQGDVRSYESGGLSAVEFTISDDDGNVVMYRVPAGRFRVVEQICANEEWDETAQEWTCATWMDRQVAVPAVYAHTGSVDLTTIHQEVLIRAGSGAMFDGSSVDFGAFRVPALEQTRDENFDWTPMWDDYGHQSVAGTWDADADGWRYTVAVNPKTTHLGITANQMSMGFAVGATIMNHMVAMPAGGEVLEVVIPSRATNVVIEGRSASADLPVCGQFGAQDDGLATVAKVTITMGNGQQPPQKPEWPGEWDTYSEYLSAYNAWKDWQPDPAHSTVIVSEAWTIVDANGNYSLVTSMDPADWDWVSIQLASAKHSNSVSANVERHVFDTSTLVPNGSGWLTISGVDNRPSCTSGG